MRSKWRTFGEGSSQDVGITSCVEEEEGLTQEIGCMAEGVTRRPRDSRGLTPQRGLASGEWGAGM